MGLSANTAMQEALADENHKYGDLLQPRVSDDYRTWPVKVLSAYQWLYWEWGNRSDFVSFTDDDFILNLPKIFDYLTSNKKKFIEDKIILCGFQYDAIAFPGRWGDIFKTKPEQWRCFAVFDKCFVGIITTLVDFSSL